LLELYRNYIGLMAQLQVGQRLQGKLSPSDLVQDTFLRAQQGFSGFRGQSEGELISWLRQILASQVADTVRRFGSQKRDMRLEQQLEHELDQSHQNLAGRLASESGTPSEHAVRREQSVILSDALARLPGDYREVLVLRHLEGLGFPEIAQRMERTHDSVRHLWVRAVARLRAEVGETL
jgi:RNA polymerase sigma-70 factor (ECF subfamily)